MINDKDFRIKIIGEKKAEVYQGEFLWGEIQIPDASWEDLKIGLRGIASIPETDINFDISEPIPVPEPAPIPEPVPEPVPEPSCTSPFCPGGIPFRSLEELRQHIDNPLTNTGDPSINEFQFNNQNIIQIKANIVEQMLK